MSDQTHIWAFRISDDTECEHEALGLLGMVHVTPNSEGVWICERHVPALDASGEWAWDVTSCRVRTSDERVAVPRTISGTPRHLMERLGASDARFLDTHPGMESLWDVPEAAYAHKVPSMSVLAVTSSRQLRLIRVTDARADADEHIWAETPVHGHPVNADVYELDESGHMWSACHTCDRPRTDLSLDMDGRPCAHSVAHVIPDDVCAYGRVDEHTADLMTRVGDGWADEVRHALNDMGIKDKLVKGTRWQTNPSRRPTS